MYSKYFDSYKDYSFLKLISECGRNEDKEKYSYFIYCWKEDIGKLHAILNELDLEIKEIDNKSEFTYIVSFVVTKERYKREMILKGLKNG